MLVYIHLRCFSVRQKFPVRSKKFRQSSGNCLYSLPSLTFAIIAERFHSTSTKWYFCCYLLQKQILLPRLKMPENMQPALQCEKTCINTPCNARKRAAHPTMREKMYHVLSRKKYMIFWIQTSENPQICPWMSWL